jgi:hypothetical protein
MQQPKIPFPEPLKHDGNVKFWRSEIELYKARVAFAAKDGNPLHVKPLKTDEPDKLVRAATFAEELAISRRTLGRLIAGVDGPGRKPVSKPDQEEARAA